MLYLDELDRLNIIQDLELFDEEEKKVFEEIATLARLICLTPTCVIVVFGEKKERFLAAQGLVPGTTPEDYLLCREAMQLSDGITVIPDLKEHPSLQGHRCVVGPPDLRFFAGAPIFAGNTILGAICLFDQRPNNLTDNQLKALQILSSRIIRIFEFDKRLTQERNRVEGSSETLQMMASQLEEHDNRYRDIVENTSDMIATVDNEGMITFANRSWLETMGLERDEQVTGRNIFDFVHPDNQEQSKKVFDLMNAGHGVIQVEVDWITRSGEKVNTAATIDGGYTEGKVAYQRGIFRDITRQKRHEHELMKNQLILTEAQKISRTGNLEVNFPTGEVKWSDELYNILEMQSKRPEDFISELYQMIHENDKEKAVQFIEQAQHRIAPSHLEFRIVTSGGNTKCVYCNGAPFIIQDHKVIVMLFTLQDITELRQFEKKVFTAAVESEERERTRMAGELHDGVCQYLASAGLMLDTLNDKLNDPVKPADTKGVKQLLDFSRSSIREGLNLVRKVSHDLFPLEFYKSGLLLSVKGLVNNLNHLGTIKFDLDIRGKYIDRDPSISINLFRIIQEFTRNSLKYSEATEVQVRINSSAQMVKLKITDNGKGFDMERVMEGQKGIGLMSMKKRIESIGGTFHYKSSPGNGVQLRLKVPMTE